MNDLALQDELINLRKRLNLTRHAMAELLYTHQQTYKGWEEGAKPHKAAAERIRRFIDSATNQIDLLSEQDIKIDDLLPLNMAAAVLGVPVESLFRAYRHDMFAGVDLGILGVWVVNSATNMVQILDAVTE